MTPAHNERVARLLAVLGAENQALLAVDYTKVGAFAEEKRSALADLEATVVAPTPPDASDPDCIRYRDLLAQLRQRIDENRTLLQRAIKVQNRIMGIVAQAARQAQLPSGYGSRGAQAATGAAKAVALIVRA